MTDLVEELHLARMRELEEDAMSLASLEALISGDEPIQAPVEPLMTLEASDVAASNVTEKSDLGILAVADQLAAPEVALDEFLTGADAELLEKVVAEAETSRSGPQGVMSAALHRVIAEGLENIRSKSPLSPALSRVIAEGLKTIESDRIERRRARLRPIWRQEYAERKFRISGQQVRHYDRQARDSRFEADMSPEERRAAVKKASYELCSPRKRINAKPSLMTDEDRAAHEKLKRDEKNAKRKVQRAAARAAAKTENIE